MSKRQYRKKAISEDGDEDGGERNDDGGHAGVDVELLQEAIELRKYRRRQHGLDAEDLLKGSGKKGGELEAAVPEKPPEVGGMIAAGFKTQTKAMDTERHMNEYVETELKKRRSPLGLLGEGGDMGDGQKSGVSDPLYEIPDHLKVAQQPVAEGSVTLSASMLTAIPEIDLGIDAKLRNIEETEKAKRKLMDDRAKPKDDTQELLGSNLVAADRWLRNTGRSRNSYDPAASASGDHAGEKSRGDRRDRATDELVMDRFKKRQKRGR